MKLSMGIVGLPNVGKSTLFKALTKNEVLIANYPFVTIDPNIGIVAVPDERLDKLAEMSKSKKKIPAILEFYDIAGLVKGASEGEGLGNQFLTHIRETNAVVEVLRCFPSDEIIHIENSVDPMRDMDIINAELMLKDLDTVEKNYKKAETEARNNIKGAREDLVIMQKAKQALEQGKMLFTKEFSDVRENEKVRLLNLLTIKPQLYLLNGRPEDVPPALAETIKDLGADYVVVDLAGHSASSGLNQLIQKAYEILGLISFFTTGEDESRAWTIRDGAKAPEAAGAIHSDFEKKFIRAEVINWQKLLEAGSWPKAKQKGTLRLEGKEYIAQDGDVMEIRHG